MFPDDINVLRAAFFPYPNKDHKLAWKEDDASVRIAPYVRIDLSVGFSWMRRKRLNS